MNNNIIGLIFGGQSAEHDISIMSAGFVRKALLQNNFEIILIVIDKEGYWRLVDNESFDGISNGHIKLSDMRKIIPIPQGKGEFLVFEGANSNKLFKIKIDIAFPVLHGPMGEDGVVQGLLKILGIPFVGADVLGSSIGMDKVIMKKVLRDSNIPVGNFLYFNKPQKSDINYNEINDVLKTPFFVKPANMGSSVGISMVDNESQLSSALDAAFNYDNKIIIEEFINGRELECSVLGDDIIAEASLPGEIKLVNNKFYSYDEKYNDSSTTIIEIPAKLNKDLSEEIQNLAIKTFKVLNCYGMGRVDFFLTKENKLIVNEINTIPGFTKISMYPKLWEASGIGSAELIRRLVDLAIIRFDKEKLLNI
ncbi:D-alanine--D-alanine ligase [Patescibacteria group bacterium]|nr:D-alanine--D-alanine ligase [Patescibacteria group bacterium]